jgi:hypothetical protein
MTRSNKNIFKTTQHNNKSISYPRSVTIVGSLAYRSARYYSPGKVKLSLGSINLAPRHEDIREVKLLTHNS